MLSGALLWLCLLSTGCATLPAGAAPSGTFDAHRLEGGWHVVASNFPMWLEGTKTEPNFIYLVTGSDPVRLSDTVAYTESGHRESILGTDTQDARSPRHFTWRGEGLLMVFASEWSVYLTGPEDRWMILYFTKTAMTPEGVDIISRERSLSPEDREAIGEKIASDAFLKDKSRGLYWLDRKKVLEKPAPPAAK